MAEICGVLHGGNTQPHDDNGCILPVHGGADQTHEFIDRDGQHWLWETDLSCTCAHCMRCEGDYCTVYWRKPDGAGDAEYESWVCVARGVEGTPTSATEQHATISERGRFEAAMCKLSNGEPDWSSPAAQWAWAAWREALAAKGVGGTDGR